MLSSILRIRSTLHAAIDDYFRSSGFCEVNPPILTPLSCEVACVGGSDLMSVNYHDQKVFLSQSGQLYLESLALQLGRVYCIAPTFRAESTLLATHLDEFWMCEAEMVNVGFDELIQFVNQLLCATIETILNTHGQELTEFGTKAEMEKVVIDGINKVKYSDAIQILRDEHIQIEWEEDILPQHELILSRYFNNAPLFITLYPKKLSSFYKQESSEDTKMTLSFDVIAPRGFREIVGGSLRETNEIKLRDSLALTGIDTQPYEWYVNMIAGNPTPHGGFGFGIERMVSWLCNLHSIEEAVPFPRTQNNHWTKNVF